MSRTIIEISGECTTEGRRVAWEFPSPDDAAGFLRRMIQDMIDEGRGPIVCRIFRASDVAPLDERIRLDVPGASHEMARDAVKGMVRLRDKYKITEADMDLLWIDCLILGIRKLMIEQGVADDEPAPPPARKRKRPAKAAPKRKPRGRT